MTGHSHNKCSAIHRNSSIKLFASDDLCKFGMFGPRSCPTKLCLILGLDFSQGVSQIGCNGEMKTF